MKFIESIFEIENEFEGILLDQFGCIHDGSTAYPDTIVTMEKLRKKNKKIIILSNSGSSSIKNTMRLEKMGYSPDLFAHVISSGQASILTLMEKEKYYPKIKGNRCYQISRHSVEDSFREIGLEFMDSIAEADFILLSGLPDGYEDMKYYEGLLAEALTKDIPLLCANPDLKMVLPGGLKMGSGAVGLKYREMGGEVYFVGKPHPIIYRFAMQDDNPGTYMSVGDSIHHDVKGGYDVGAKTCLILTGVAAEFIGCDNAETASRILNFCDNHQLPQPDYVLRGW